MSQTKSERVEARVAPESAELIRCAADLSGRSLSSFMVEAALQKAQVMIAEHRQTVVPVEYFDSLLRALEEPADAVPALERAASRMRRNVRHR